MINDGSIYSYKMKMCRQLPVLGLLILTGSGCQENYLNGLKGTK
jgi:hypothetical protein